MLDNEMFSEALTELKNQSKDYPGCDAAIHGIC